MPRHISKADASAIDEILTNEPNVNLHEVANRYNTTYETVRQRRVRIRRFQSTGIDERKRAGPRGKVTEAIKEYALWLISKDNQLYEDEVATHIEYEFNVKLSQPTISRLWASTQITHKALEVAARQRNQI